MRPITQDQLFAEGVRPTSKVRDTARQLKDTAKETRKNTRRRRVPCRPTEVRKSSGGGSSRSDGRAMLQKALDLLGEVAQEDQTAAGSAEGTD
jgi:hypothetical protein